MEKISIKSVLEYRIAKLESKIRSFEEILRTPHIMDYEAQKMRKLISLVRFAKDELENVTSPDGVEEYKTFIKVKAEHVHKNLADEEFYCD